MKFSPPTIEGETPVTLAIETLYQTCASSLSTLKSPYSLSFLQKSMKVSFIQLKSKATPAPAAEEPPKELTEEEKAWQKKLGKNLKEFIPLPDIRIPVFDKSRCKEGEDTFMCMTDFISKH